MYPVRWAESPDEVPNFDPSCGMPLDIFEFDLDKSHKLTEAPRLGYPRLVRALPIDPFDDALWQIENEGVLEEDLVTEEEFLKGVNNSPFDLAHEDVIGDVVSFAKDAWLTDREPIRFKNVILKLAQKYGPPYRHDENTLQAWKRLAIEVRTEVQLYRDLKDFGYEIVTAAMVERVNELAQEILGESFDNSHQARSPFPRGSVRGGIHLDAVSLTHNYCGDPNDLRYVELQKLIQLWVWTYRTDDLAQSNNLNEAAIFRRTVAEERFNDFGRAVSTSHETHMRPNVVFTARGVEVDCVLATWLDYKLSEMWRANRDVGVCPVCGTLFLQTRTNRKYCSRGSCADKHYRNQRQRVHEN